MNYTINTRRFNNRNFFHNITPILTYEIIADLSKKFKKGRLSFDKVKELASKIIGSGNPVNANYRSICIGSLLGYHPPIDTGQAVVDHGTRVPLENGKFGVFIDMSPLNKAILRWSNGKFDDSEIILANLWRTSINRYDIEVFKSQIDKLQIILPRVNNTDELKNVINDYSLRSPLQESWLKLVLSLVRPSNNIKEKILSRWQCLNYYLKDFSPYAFYCVKVILALQIATRSKIIKWKPSNILDMEYLFYLPFCMLFVSSDNLHIKIAPLLVRENQSFVNGDDFKNSIKLHIDHWNELDDNDKELLKFALGSYPYPIKGSIIPPLWKKHCIPWNRWERSNTRDFSEKNKKEILDFIEEQYKTF